MTSDRTCAAPTTGTGSTDPRVIRSQARVLEAATDLLVESGPQAVTVDAVSQRSGVAKSTLYRHWPSQTALLVDVIRANVPPLPEVDPSLDFEGALRAHLDALVHDFHDPRWRRIMPALFVLKRQIEEVEAINETEMEERKSLLDQLFRLGVAEGRLPTDLDPSLLMCSLFGPLLFAMLNGMDHKQVADHVLRQVLAANPPHGAG